MKKFSLSVTCCMLVAMVLFNSCAKDGPAGATGPAGPAGPTGATGTAGPAGPAGTANVIYSEWLDQTYTVERNTAGDTIGFTSNITAAKLTADVLNKGEIKVYLNAGTAASPRVFPIPYTDGFDIINVIFFVGRIQLSATDNFGTFTNTTGKFLQYRYILIPGATTARSMAETKAVNWDNYNEVKEYLHLKD